MVVATGFFDGVHLGHRRVIDRLVSAAGERGTESCVITFWPHPRKILRAGDSQGLGLLSTLDEKCSYLRELGVDRIEIIPFTEAFSRMTTAQYLEQIVIGRLGGTALVLGYDNRMGCDSSGADEVARVAESLGVEVIRETAIFGGDLAISSTRIREALLLGDVTSAGKMLGRRYRIDGRLEEDGRFIVSGSQAEKLIPRSGEYSVIVSAGGKDLEAECIVGRDEDMRIDCGDSLPPADYSVTFVK